jgi:hypothetical protein
LIINTQSEFGQNSVDALLPKRSERAENHPTTAIA